MNHKFKIVVIVLIYILAALSVAAGVPKILQMPQELDFLNSIGFSPLAVSALGIIQSTGGVLLLWKKSRLPGAVLASAALLVSSIAIFLGGNTKFALISLIPFAVSILVIFGSSENYGRSGV